ncbi:hypothetical protein O0L34_g6392 [Tuta absoluta]|nr:hypothetical protein O0L34_g6392 [Tuta absoluta]
MTGAAGRLVVLDRLGRPGKAFPLESGAATIGRAHGCDVRFLLPTVAPHHATLLVHKNQAVIRSEGSEETLVNGFPVSVAALQHGDEISLGGAASRRLRWEYRDRHQQRPLQPLPGIQFN